MAETYQTENGEANIRHCYVHLFVNNTAS